MCTRRLFCGCLVAIGLLHIPTIATALNPIPVTNGSFEDPSIYPGGQGSGGPDYIPGWKPDPGTTGATAGIWNFTASTYGLFPAGNAPDGQQTMMVGHYVGAGSMTQTLPTVLSANAHYELTGYAGNPATLVSTYTISLSAFDGTTRTTLASMTQSGPDGLMATWQLDFDSGATPYAGQNLQITLQSEAVQTCFDLIQLSTSAAVIPGDINGDTQVNLIDYGILTSHWLQTVQPGLYGDLNSDGKISIPDFSMFKTNYNAFNGGGGESLAVPEPGTIILLAIASPALLLALRRRRRNLAS